MTVNKPVPCSIDDIRGIQEWLDEMALQGLFLVEFNRRFDMKNKLKAHYPDYLDQWQREKKRSGCILAGRVFNLITKERYFQKPTYETLRGALECMKALCVQKGVRRAAMPVIGCGLDRLAWEQVSAVIQDVFSDTGIEILVCIK